MIYDDDILIAYHTYEEHINTITAVVRIAEREKLWYNKNQCQFMPA